VSGGCIQPTDAQLLLLLLLLLLLVVVVVHLTASSAG
jgi:hypothetical protein